MNIYEGAAIAPVFTALAKVAYEERWVIDLPEITVTGLLQARCGTVYQMSFKTKSPFIPTAYLYFYYLVGEWHLFTTEEGNRKFTWKANEKLLTKMPQMTVGTTAEFIKVLLFELNH